MPTLTASNSDVELGELHGDPFDLASYVDNPDSDTEEELLGGEEEPMDTNVQVPLEVENRLLGSPEVLELDPTGNLNFSMDEPATPRTSPATQDPHTSQETPVIQEIQPPQREREDGELSDDSSPPVVETGTETGPPQSDGGQEGDCQEQRRSRQRGNCPGQSGQTNSVKGAPGGKRGPRTRC
jgi:hypothetical protein